MIPLRALGIALCVSCLPAQQDPRGTAPGPKMDPLARKIMRAWEDLEYHPGRAGVTRIAFDLAISGTNKLQGRIEAKASYKFDGARGQLSFKGVDKKLQQQLKAEGWSAQSFDRRWIPGLQRRELAGTTLSAGETEDGVVIRIDGRNPRNLRELHFDKQGVCTRWVIEKGEGKSRTEITVSHRYLKVGGKHLRSGWTLGTRTPAGEVLGKTEVAWMRVGRFWVWEKVFETVHVSGKPFSARTIQFSGYEINGHIKQGADPDETGPGEKKTGTRKVP